MRRLFDPELHRDVLSSAPITERAMIGADGLMAAHPTTVTVKDLIGAEHDVLRPEEAQRAALKYIEMGWAVTAGPGLDSMGVCSCPLGKGCRNAGKHAYAGWGNESRRTLSAEQAERYWSPGNGIWKDKPVDQVFIVPYLSGLAVADVDDEAAWAALPVENRPETLTQASGSGRGGHRLYAYDWDLNDNTPPSLRGKLPGTAGELKFRGIIAAAPSMHKSGGRYLWTNWGSPITPAPRSLTTRAPSHTGMWSVKQPENPDRADHWAQLAFLGDCASLDSAARAGSSRPLVLFAAAASMNSWVAAGWITESEVVARLLEAAERNGAATKYGAADIERQVRNGIAAGLTEGRAGR